MLKIPASLLIFLGLFLSQYSFAKPVNILPLGDSITAGIGPDLPKEALPSYRRDLWHMLNNAGYDVSFVGNKHHFADIETLDNKLKDYSPNYEGYAGITAHEINSDPNNEGYKISTLMNDGNYTPDIALIHLGSNDLLQNKPSNQTLTALEGIIAQLQDKNPSISILIARIIPLHPYDAPETEISNTLNRLLTTTWATQQSTAQSKVEIVDLNTHYPIKNSYWDEGIHPSALGEAFMAQQCFDALKSLPIMLQNQNKITLKKPPITQNLTLHLDALDINADGIQDNIQEISKETLLTIWKDKSKKHNDAKSQNTPAPTRINNNKLNHQPTIAFKQAGLKTLNDKQITANNAYTKFVVFKFNNSKKANHLLSSTTSFKGDTGTTLWGAGKSNISIQHNDNPSNFINSNNFKTGFHIVSFRYSPKQLGNLISLEGEIQQINNAVHPHQPAFTTIGYANDKFLDGSIAEALIYDKALTNDEIEQTERYLAKKWRLKLKEMTSIDIAKLAIIEDIIGNLDKVPASAVQINLFISDTIAKNGLDYSFSLQKGTYNDRNNPTKDEVIKAIMHVNSTNKKNQSSAGSIPPFLLLTVILAMIYRRFFNQHLNKESYKM